MFVVILIVIAILYLVFFGGKSSVSTGQTNSGLQSTTTGTSPVTGIVQNPSITSVEASKIGQEFVNQLLSLQAIKLNDEVFSSLAFQSLEDFTIVLVQPGNEGRPNPFAPFGADGVEPGTTSDQALDNPGNQVDSGGLDINTINDLPPAGGTLPGLEGS